jgi:5-oxoprolinase (ATP-hydrolysing) subunit A
VSRLELNADVGESFGRWRLGDDEALLGVVTSANVACGFHAGDPLTLRRTCAAATARGVRIGAQIGYRDLAGFGRRFIDVAADDLAADVLYQLGALDAFARVAGGRVRYVKPHGALYNAVVRHEAQAAAIVDAVRAYDPGLSILGLPGSALLGAAEARGLRTVAECFADRAYRCDGSLVPRTEPGAVLADVDTVVARAVRMAVAHEVVADDGAIVTVTAESICVHGDTPGAVEIAGAVRTALDHAGVTLVAFAD